MHHFCVPALLWYQSGLSRPASMQQLRCVLLLLPCLWVQPSQGYNLISNTTNCQITGNTTGNKLNVLAKLGTLSTNGGYTLTHLPQATSPVIDAGNPATPGRGAWPQQDQRGVSRPRGPHCDIGVVEC